ncbi:MAG: pyruvate formate-lyase-activating protein [Acutalibacteraceae bacterium]|nr:pyruvate formate-lyase-activating protein [Acutalibacteraceae bacterium]
MKGIVHSFQSLGAIDGPGIRFVVFTQGCNLRCGCCHNPDTWKIGEGTEYTAEEVVKRAARYKEYFGAEGGITVSGGEPLLQADFVKEIFELCHKEGINTCLDTSGSIMNDSVKALLKETGRVLLDIKYTCDSLYKEHAGCGLQNVLDFLEYLNAENIPVTLRQVIIPSLNDNEENILKIKNIANSHKCVDKTELLAFRKICQVKYDKLGIKFPFEHIPEPDKNTMAKLNQILI